MFAAFEFGSESVSSEDRTRIDFEAMLTGR